MCVCALAHIDMNTHSCIHLHTERSLVADEQSLVRLTREEERSRKIWRKKEGRQEGRTQRGTKWREQRKEEEGLSELSWWGQCGKHTEGRGRNRLIRGHQQRGDHLGSHSCGVKNASQCLVPRTRREQILDQIAALNVCTWSQKMRSSPMVEGEAALKWRSCLEVEKLAWSGDAALNGHEKGHYSLNLRLHFY